MSIRTNKTADPGRVAAVQGRRRSNASGAHLQGPRRRRDRRSSRHAAIRFSADAG